MAGEKPTRLDHIAPSEPLSPVSGLDMKPTINWYATNQQELARRIPTTVGEPLPFPIQDTSYFHVSPDQINALIRLFPNQALTRSRLNTGTIIGKPSLYFAYDATPEAIKTTPDQAQALSPTAIIPSYTDNTRWQQTGKPSSDVWLFEISPNIPEGVKKIIHAEGLVHEIAHTIVTQALYANGYRLRLPNGEVVSGFDFITHFAEEAEKHEPVSHYSSFYRNRGEEFKNTLAIEEEFVETIAARLLGFAYNDNPDKRHDPLKDRPEILAMVEDFLHAVEVKS